MLENYLLSAFRALKRDKLYATINILGLAVSLTAGLLILLFVRYELSYDEWIPDSERIYRLHTTYDFNNYHSVLSSGPMAEYLPLSFPEIESTLRLAYYTSTTTILYEGEAFGQSIQTVDRIFFDFFDLPLVEGTPRTALNDYSSIVINETTRRRFFGERTAVGETLTVCCIGDETRDFMVTAVLKDLPGNSHLELQAIILINKSEFPEQYFDTWMYLNTHTFVKFHPGTDVAAIENRLPAFIDEKIAIPGLKKATGFDNSSDAIRLSLKNMQNLHMGTSVEESINGDFKSPGSMTLVLGFAATAILILIMASINFINLSTARSGLRAREVGLRKTVGAERKQLIFQFLGESILVTVIAMILAIILAGLTMPLYNNFLGTDISFRLFSDPILLASLIGIISLVGIFSGLYPALHLSSYKPVRILSSNSNNSATSQAMGALRKVLVAVQFMVITSLLIITVMIFFQIQYAKSVELGFNRENKLVLRGVSTNRESRDTFVNEVLRLPEVRTAVLSSEAPTDNIYRGSVFTHNGQRTGLNAIFTDYGYMEAYGINLLAGRDISGQYSSDNLNLPPEEGVIQTVSALVNESAMRHLGFADPTRILGLILNSGQEIQYRIIGVIPDIQMRSIKFDIRPNIYYRQSGMLNTLVIAIEGNNIQALINKVEPMWHDAFPLTPFEYSFVDELINNQYAEEDQQSLVFQFFTGLAILVAFLGLFGLASFVIVQRTKEVGIRKVLGAEVLDIIKLMLWQFSKPVLLASIIAWPVAWYVSHIWLQGFEQRISAFNPYLFIGATFAALAIACLTVAGHTLKAARTKPANALRYE